MAQLLVRNIEENVKERLRRRATRHGHSTEEEVRDILRNAVRTDVGARAPLGTRLKARFVGIGIDEDIAPLRGTKPRAAALREKK
ncbi:MAG: toxin-antitoxin system [Vicinamibacteria bacterium]|nr:toxin-antitoxin system [Vicinamibacteria bacterium]